MDSGLDEIIDLYQYKIYNLALRYTGDPSEASDLSQEIFFRLYRKIRLYRKNSNFDVIRTEMGRSQGSPLP